MRGSRSRWTGATILVLLSAGCGDDSPRATAPADIVEGRRDSGTAVDRTGSDHEALRSDAVAASIDVRADGCGARVGFGSGAMFDDDLALTAAHVVAGAGDVEVIDTEGRRSTATVVAFDPDLDLAVLRTHDAVGHPIDLRSVDARAGERGVAALPRWIGDDLTLRVADIEVVRTVNISTTDIYLDDEVDRPGFEVAATIDPGDSGALVVLPGGGAGLIWARTLDDTTSAWAVDLPAELTGDPDDRPDWTTPADTGDCTR